MGKGLGGFTRLKTIGVVRPHGGAMAPRPTKAPSQLSLIGVVTFGRFAKGQAAWLGAWGRHRLSAKTPGFGKLRVGADVLIGPALDLMLPCVK